MSQRKWRIESRQCRREGVYRVERLRFQHELLKGGSSEVIEQELFNRGNVVGVLPYDPSTDRIVLVEQFRLGAMNRKPSPWLIEIIAGKIETKEMPCDAACREALEEGGVQLESPELISNYLISPSISSDEVFIFFAEADLSSVGGHHGLAQENEDILARTVPVDEAFSMLDEGLIRNSLSIIALQWLRVKRAN